MEWMLPGWILAVAAAAAFFAGVSKGGFGSGAAFVSSAILALVIDPAAALGIMLPVLMVIDVSNLRPYWKKWDAPSSKVLIFGGIPGIFIGAALFAVVSEDVIRVMIGAVALAFPLWQLARARGIVRFTPKGFNPVAGLFWGAVTGFTSFVSHAGGPPASVFLLSQPAMGKTTYQATTVIVFWAINLMKAAIYAAIGIFTAASLLASLALAPFAVAGAWVGVRAHHAIPERAFFGFTYVALALTGIRLIWLGLT
ncbi:TSUP family transporter [Rhodobacterales bacterium HKCCE2091]|nr:TSUP family transporter [Rhodobacterales bacterium HKCCE2091]